MNWSHVILAGYVGAVIATFISLIKKKGWIGKLGGIILTLVAIALWNIVDISYLRKANVENNLKKSEAALQSIPTYKVIKEYDPQTFYHLRKQILSMVKDRENEQKIIDNIRPKIFRIQMKRLQFSPDDQVVALIKINMEQIAAIQKVSNRDCYRFLFPEIQGGINPMKILSNELLTRRINIDAEMMRSSYGPNRHIITDEERRNAKKGVQLVAQKLMSEYGEDIAILDDPRKGLGKEKISCELVQAMWKNVILMPEKEAAGIIRMIMTPEEK